MPGDGGSILLERTESTESTGMQDFERNVPSVVEQEQLHSKALEEEEEDNNAFQKLTSINAKVKYILYNIRTEFLLFVHIFMYMASEIVIQTLLLQKACSVTLKYPDYICHELLAENKTANISTVEDEVQKVVAGIQTWKSAVQNIIPILFVMFMGSWTDRHGRKMCILIPLFGFIVKHIALVISVLNESWSGQTVVLVAYIPIGITGSTVALMMAFNSYCIDYSTLANRTWRLGMLNSCLPIGISLGMSLGGIIYKYVGFLGLFSISGIGEILCFIYTIVIIHDIKRPKLETPRNIFCDIFDVKNVVNVFKTVFKKRENNNNLKLLLLFLILFLAFWPEIGEASVLLLFARKRLRWNQVQYGFYTTFALVTMVIGCIASMYVMSHKLKLADEIVGMSSSFSSLISNTFLCFTVTSWMMFLGPVLGFLMGAMLFICRSMPTKLVGKEEIGKINAFIAVLESIAPVIATPVYSELYTATLDTFPGAFFLLSAGVAVFPLTIYIWLYISRRRAEQVVVETLDTVEKTRF